MSTGWLTDERAELAAGRILDVAEELFLARGVSSVTMRHLASAVGCSRATLYRYFPGKQELHAAYVDRTARGLAASIAEQVRGIADPGDRLTTAITAALAGVRADPALLAWFTPDAAGTSTRLALLSPAIESIAGSFLQDLGVTDAERALRAQWLVRVIVSLLTDPDPDNEEALLRRFVLPVVLT